MAERSRRKRALVWVTALGLGLPLLGWGTTKLLRMGLHRAETATKACLDAIDVEGVGDPASCRQTGPSLALARNWPWTRNLAGRQDADLERAVLVMQMRVATTRDFDAEARDRAARALLDLGQGEFGESFRPFVLVDDVGALEVTANHGEAVGRSDQSFAIAAALKLGDWSRAKQLAMAPLSDESDLGDADLRAAVVLCILGEREPAALALRASERAYEARMDRGSIEARRVALLCGIESSGTKPLLDLQTEDLAIERAIFEGGPLDIDPRRTVDAAILVMDLARASSAIEGELAWPDDRRALALLDRIDGQKPAAWFGRGIYDRSGTDGPLVVEEVEQAAKRLRELAAAAPAAAPVEREVEEDSNRAEYQAPRTSLLWGSFLLANAALTERNARGQLAAAKADLAFIREIELDEAFAAKRDEAQLLLLRQLAWLDPAAALALVDGVRPELVTSDPVMQAEIRLAFAMLLERAGRRDEARALADLVIEASASGVETSLVARDLDEGAEWIRGVLGDARQASPPETLEGAKAADVALYWRAAAAQTPEAALLRWRARGSSQGPTLLSVSYLPILLDLAARGVPADKREVWLDDLASEVYFGPLDYVRVRSAAAERLGDESAAATWRAREAALLEPLQTDRAMALYRILWP